MNATPTEWFTLDEIVRIRNRNWAALDDVARQRAYKCEQKRLHRARFTFKRDEADMRRRLYPASVLASEERDAWHREQSAPPALALTQPDAVQVVISSEPYSLQALLPFVPTSPSQAARDKELPAVPEKYRPAVDEWGKIIANDWNGTYLVYKGHEYGGVLVRTKSDFMRDECNIHGIKSLETIRRRLRFARAIHCDPTIPENQKWAKIYEGLVPKPRPGRSKHSFFCEADNAWQFPVLLDAYMNQARRSVPVAREILCGVIDKKRKAHGLNHPYQYPTLGQCRLALEQVSKPRLALARLGEKVYEDKFGSYISRRPPIYSGDVVSTDQKYLDILCRDHSWRVGRIWVVNFIDVSSQYWLGAAFGPTLAGDMVMDAAAMMLGKCVPGAVQMDQGKEFKGQRFTGGFFKISGARYYAEAAGLWERLGVRIIEAIGMNPKTKPIERWHGCLREFEQMWPTRTGSNPQDRPEQLSEIEKRIQDQVELFKQGKGDPPPIPTIEQVVRGFLYWCEHVWNLKRRGHGRYRGSLTPFEAWNVRAPQAGHHFLTPSEIDYYTCDRRYLKVARGGQINVVLHGQTVQYEAPELFDLQGRDERVEVLISRQDLSEVKVLYPVSGGTGSCIAKWKQETTWGKESRETVTQRLRCIAAVRRAQKRGIKIAESARLLLENVPWMPTADLIAQASENKLIDTRQAFGAPQLQPDPDAHAIGSTEYVMRRRAKTSSEIADEFMKKEVS